MPLSRGNLQYKLTNGISSYATNEMNTRTQSTHVAPERAHVDFSHIHFYKTGNKLEENITSSMKEIWRQQTILHYGRNTQILSFKVVLRLSTTFAPVLQHGRIATIVICLHTLRRASTRKLNRFWQNWHLQRWLIVKSKSKMASRPRQRPSTTEKPTMTFSVKPRLICIITKRTGSLNEHSAND